ncbi:sulfate transporter [Caldalkalibacillus thermarum TA2.A1]|uniref:Solute carrier family 26 protein n=1 Tax=Caldalkalibacillus thermarum (strain TA2.A1) TaxID=986075 RepID=F5L8L3_CALTT|nr:solute carrier family 26 protein [Caldalkalibacillus thermarum]EGL82352.1 sulfate transporter [Caldalkalibacillus thermarum TA2.A1]QZT32915.1 solute carrier family 26 protein [Caldalkalibacillus thermarum TA2.A1]
MSKQWMPGLSQLIPYQREHLSGDLTSGLIVAVMLIPQGLAYAMLAGVDPVIGLYSVTIPLLVYALFASSRHLAVGPVAMVSLLVFSGVSALAEPGSPQFVAYVLLLSLLVGLIQLVMGVMRLGFLVNFLSHAVISGFTSAAAIVIGLSQLKHLLGVPLATHEYTHQLILEAIGRWREIDPITLALGLGSIALLVVLKRVTPRLPAPIVVVLLAVVLIRFFNLDQYGVSIVGDVPRGIPGFSVPDLSMEAVQLLLPTAFTIALVGFMESIAVAKTIAAKEKYKVDPDQELRGLGLANIAGSFFSSMPVTGGFSRTAVNYQSGAKTVLASIVTAVLVIMTLLFLTPLFYYLPHAVLAAIIMVAVYGLIDVREALHLFKVKQSDGWILLITFFSTLLIGIEPGIMIGVAVSLLLFIWRSAYPHVAELGYLEQDRVFRNIRRYPQAKTFKNALLLRVDASLYFANMAFLENKLEHYSQERPELQWIVMDMSGVNDMDAVAVDALEAVMDNLKQRGIRFAFANMKGPVLDVVHRANWNNKVGKHLYYMSVAEAVEDLGLQYAP